MTQQPPQEPMNREMRRMSSKMGYDPENQREQMKKNAKKTRKPAPHEQRVPFFKRFFGFFKEAAKELKKVNWPNKKEVLNSTIIVLVCIVFVTLLIVGVDYGAEKLANFIYG